PREGIRGGVVAWKLPIIASFDVNRSCVCGVVATASFFRHVGVIHAAAGIRERAAARPPRRTRNYVQRRCEQLLSAGSLISSKRARIAVLRQIVKRLLLQE